MLLPPRQPSPHPPQPRHPRAPQPSPIAMSGAAASAAAAAAASASAHPANPARPHWVFVYGTLRAGGAHHAALRDSTYLGAFRTAAAYPRILSTAYFAPTLLDQPGAGARADGEVYAVSDATLRALDKLENAGPHGRYARRALDVVHRTDPSRRARAYAYMKRDLAADLAAAPEVLPLAATAPVVVSSPAKAPTREQLDGVGGGVDRDTPPSILDLHARSPSHPSPLPPYPPVVPPAVADHVGSSMYAAANCNSLR